MSELRVDSISNTGNGGTQNLILNNDGSVDSSDGFSISNAAANTGLKFKLLWDNVNVDQTYDLDRTKYNCVRIKGWFDLSYEPVNNVNIGLYIQPTIGGVPQLLSAVNNTGTTNTWIQTVEDSTVSEVNANQMLYNTSNVLNTLGYRWMIDHEIILADKIVWTTLVPSMVWSNNGGGFERIVRSLLPQSWDSANGNNVDGFRIVTNSVTAVSTLSRGLLGVTISKDSSYDLLT